MLDVLACGEMLIDFVATESGATLAQAAAFKKVAGGAPANVAIGVARLGCRAGFMGKLGDDEFGRFLAQTLRDQGVDTSGLCLTAQARTALAFVSLLTDGERDFLFYRHPSADMLWSPADVDGRYAADTRIFHYGSISLIGEPSRSATLAALAAARSNGALISYDPNLRLPLWSSPQAARAGVLQGWQQAHVIKVSEEELAFLNDAATIEGRVQALWHDDLRLLVVTQGRAGCTYFTAEHSEEIPGFAVQPVDTTGAGDGFVAGMLVGLLQHGLQWDHASVKHALRLGNAVGALATTKHGAISAQPTLHQVRAFMQQAEAGAV
jgi:fructokinase